MCRKRDSLGTRLGFYLALRGFPEPDSAYPRSYATTTHKGDEARRRRSHAVGHEKGQKTRKKTIKELCEAGHFPLTFLVANCTKRSFG